MRHVKLRSDLADVARRAADRWYVTTGDHAVGPVNLDLLARGVESGKVPLEAFVRHEQWKVWRPLRELATVVRDEDDAGRESTDDIADLGRPSVPADFTPSDALAGAADRRDALALLMTASVVRGAADAAIVHEIEDHGALVVCAHGDSDRVAALTGARSSLADASVVAAAAGDMVIADVDGDLAAVATRARLASLAPAIEAAIMLPIRPFGRLAAMIELGRRAPFQAAEIASLEALVEALVHKLERWGA